MQTNPRLGKIKAILADAKQNVGSKVGGLSKIPSPQKLSRGQTATQYTVTFKEEKLGFTIQRGIFCGRARVAAVQSQGVAESMGVRVGDAVIGLCGGAGSGLPSTTVTVESYDQFMRFYRAARHPGRPLILTFARSPVADVLNSSAKKGPHTPSQRNSEGGDSSREEAASPNLSRDWASSSSSGIKSPRFDESLEDIELDNDQGVTSHFKLGQEDQDADIAAAAQAAAHAAAASVNRHVAVSSYHTDALPQQQQQTGIVPARRRGGERGEEGATNPQDGSQEEQGSFGELDVEVFGDSEKSRQRAGGSGDGGGSGGDGGSQWSARGGGNGEEQRRSGGGHRADGDERRDGTEDLENVKVKARATAQKLKQNLSPENVEIALQDMKAKVHGWWAQTFNEQPPSSSSSSSTARRGGDDGSWRDSSFVTEDGGEGSERHEEGEDEDGVDTATMSSASDFWKREEIGPTATVCGAGSKEKEAAAGRARQQQRRFDAFGGDEGGALLVREQARRQWRKQTRDHLERFLAIVRRNESRGVFNKPPCTYEEWLCSLHPHDEARWRDPSDGVAKKEYVDTKFYLSTSDHLALWRSAAVSTQSPPSSTTSSSSSSALGTPAAPDLVPTHAAGGGQQPQQQQEEGGQLQYQADQAVELELARQVAHALGGFGGGDSDDDDDNNDDDGAFAGSGFAAF